MISKLLHCLISRSTGQGTSRKMLYFSGRYIAKMSYATESVHLKEDDFGCFLDKTTGMSIPVRRFTWKNKNSVQIQVITYGATITTIKVPDQNGIVEDVTMGFDDMEGYLQPLNPYFGAAIGRVANRIGGPTGGDFKIDETLYSVTKNHGKYTLHGGLIGFDKVMWNHDIQGKSVVFSYLSKHCEEGFPGDLLVNLTHELTDKNEFKIDLKAYTTRPTVVNLTNHAYFNLAGHNKGAAEVYKHTVQINASRYSGVDADYIPTGELVPVANTIFDLQTPQILEKVVNKVPGGGYDHNFCLNTGHEDSIIFNAKATHVPSGRILEVYSNQPGLQFYTGNTIPKLKGKNNSEYSKHGSFCFETQNYPDAINHDNFPNSILRPGECYNNITYYVFSTNKNKHCK